MADVNRLRIVRRLATARRAVAELIAHVGLSQPLVSWHVGRLRGAGVVETRRQGR
jgi:DNA-binding transcriptional ArsR family regulator